MICIKVNMKQNSKLSALWQFVKFGMIGALNTVLSYLIYNFCYYVFHSGIHIANLVGFIITVFIENICGNKRKDKQCQMY